MNILTNNPTQKERRQLILFVVCCLVALFPFFSASSFGGTVSQAGLLGDSWLTLRDRTSPL